MALESGTKSNNGFFKAKKFLIKKMSKRIVSLLPSSTEIICKLGFRNQLVGVSHECDYPNSVKGLPILTKPRFAPQGVRGWEGLEFKKCSRNAA